MKKQKKLRPDEMIRQIPVEKSLEFLRNLLERNEALLHQYTEWFGTEAGSSGNGIREVNAERLIAAACKRTKLLFDKLDFEDIDWEDYVPRHNGYIPDYEAVEHMAEDQLDDLFDHLQAPVIHKIRQGHLQEAACELAGIVDACMNAAVNGADDDLGDFAGELSLRLGSMIDDLVSEAESVVYSEVQVRSGVHTIIEHFVNKHRGDPKYLKNFEPFLITLITGKSLANEILDFMNDLSVDESLIPALTVKLCKLAGDQSTWVKKAERFMEDDPEIARQLFDYYFENDPVLFVDKGRNHFRKFPDETAEYFRSKVKPELDRTFYTEILWHEAATEDDIDDYKELRKYIDPEGRKKFSDEVKHNTIFWAKVMAVEKRFEEILRHLQNEEVHIWHYAEVITPLLPVYPEETFENIIKKIRQTLQEARDRDTYRLICEWLNLAGKIKSLKEKHATLVHELNHRKPALPALRDEMRKAGVVEEIDEMNKSTQ